MAEYLNKSGLTTVASFVNEKLKQCPIMPVASSTLVGTIVQYVGLSTENYTKGLFYICEQDNDTYFWQKISVNDLSLYQTKNLSAAMTINGQSATTVESALTTLNSQKVDTEQNKSLMSADEHTKLAGIETGAEVNVQVDWDQTSSVAKDYIKNKPTLGTAAAKDVPASGDAGITEVVLGSDSRLTDSRNAADVYSWAKAETKPTYTASEVGAIAATLKGTANGVAELDSTGKVPSSQLPSYVDDVIEGYLYNGVFYAESTHETEIPGVSGKIYVDLVTNRAYRWSGSLFAEISESLALGETSSTAYRGDLGKTAYDDSQTNKTNIGSLSSLNTTAKTDLVSAVNEVNTNKQNKTLDTSLTIGGQTKTTVEAALDALNSTKQDNLTFDSTPTENSTNPVTSGGVYAAIKSGGGSGTKPKVLTTRCKTDMLYWQSVTWNGLTDFNGSYIWTDGDNIYYSYGTNQYILNKSTSTWTAKTWNGLTDLYGSQIWTDGDNVYYSYGAAQYVLNKSTSTWTAKTWNGLTWNGLTYFRSNYIWTDGNDIYYSCYLGANYAENGQKVLKGDTWSNKTWNGISSTAMKGEEIWTYGDNIYYSDGAAQYVLSRGTSLWTAKKWNGLSSFYAEYIWTDGENIYSSDGTNHYILKKTKVSLRK